MKVFRHVSVEDAARGDWASGPLVVANTREEATTLHPTGTIMEILTKAEMEHRRREVAEATERKILEAKQMKLEHDQMLRREENREAFFGDLAAAGLLS